MKLDIHNIMDKDNVMVTFTLPSSVILQSSKDFLQNNDMYIYCTVLELPSLIFRKIYKIERSLEHKTKL